MSLYTANIKEGMPTVEVARARLSHAMRRAKAGRHKVLKIIHGYGSSGPGGAIKADVHRQLEQQKKRELITTYVKGENFSPFDAEARRIIDACPELRYDPDYVRTNHGITIVLL